MSDEAMKDREESRKPKKSRKPRRKPEADKMPIRAWISLKMAQDKRLRREQAREIEVFLKKQGLGEMEEQDKYEKAFSKF